MRCGLVLLAIFWFLTAVSAARCEDQVHLMLDTGGHQAAIKAVTFTADGRYLVSAGDDKVIRVWDWQAGKTVRAIRGRVGPGDEGKIFAMALSPNGRWLAVGGWMAPEGHVGDEETGDIQLYDFATGELTALLKPTDRRAGPINALAFCLDNRRLVSGYDFSAVIWDVETRQALQPPLQGHKEPIYGVAFTPDCARVVTASNDKTLRLWDVANGALVKIMEGHSDKVSALAVSSEDGTIASGDDSGEICLWDSKTGSALRSGLFAHLGGYVGSLSFSPNGQMLLATCAFSGCDTVQRVFDVTSNQELTAYSEHDNAVVASAFSRNSQLVATAGGSDQSIHIWDPRSGDTKAVLKGAGHAVFAVAFSADGRQFAWGFTYEPVSQNNRGPLEMTLRLPTSDEPLGEPEKVTSQAGWIRAREHFGQWSLHHRAGGAYGLNDAILDIVQGGQVEASITRDATNGYRHLAYSFTPDGTIISAGSGGALIAYSREGKIENFFGHEDEVQAAAVSPEGKYLVSGAADQTVRLWDVKSRQLLVTLVYGSDGEWVMWTPEGFFTRRRKAVIELAGRSITDRPRPLIMSLASRCAMLFSVRT